MTSFEPYGHFKNEDSIFVEDDIASVSIVIPNYNYGRFVADAVKSALMLRWHHPVEVIVVDDGSTDDSIEVLAQFAGSIRLIQQANAGPREACNRGFAESSGSAVLFLDSDDVLESEIVHEAAEVWDRSVSKVQFQMQRIDESGNAIVGGIFPRSGMDQSSAHRFRQWMLETSAYPTPPGSGNLYSRTFLQQVFPLDDRCGDATDSSLLAAAPLLGDVKSVARPMVKYRVHQSNRSKLTNVERFAKQIDRAVQRQEYALSLVLNSHQDVLSTVRRGRHLLQMRVSAYRLAGRRAHLAGDNLPRLLFDAIRSPLNPGPEPWAARLLISVWCAVVLAAPRRLAKRLIASRFS